MWSLPAKLSKYCLLFQPPNNRTFFKLTKMNLHSSTLIFAKQEFYFKFILDYNSQGLIVWAGQPDLYSCWIVLPRVKGTCQRWWTTFMVNTEQPLIGVGLQFHSPRQVRWVGLTYIWVELCSPGHLHNHWVTPPPPPLSHFLPHHPVSLVFSGPETLNWLVNHLCLGKEFHL